MWQSYNLYIHFTGYTVREFEQLYDQKTGGEELYGHSSRYQFFDLMFVVALALNKTEQQLYDQGKT